MKKIALLLTLPLFVNAQIRGKVINVHDGDTFTLLTDDSRIIKIRLHAIDCPELAQPFGDVAKERVKGLILGKEVYIDSVTTDKYKRVVSVAYMYGNYPLNEQLLIEGLAWHYKKYDKTKRLARYENKARKKRIGLWSTDAISPEQFRHSKPIQ